MSPEAMGRPLLVVSCGLFSDTVVVRLSGEIDAYGLAPLREHLRRVWELPPTSFLILDLREVGFCDSMGMNELLDIMHRCEARDTRLLLGGVQGVMARVLSITGLRNAFEVFGTLDEALRRAAVRA
ncbi:STAS domain-containing protein [Nonomuraea sp. MCN248]|uniref:Anti-sigma factor antagonist n=1 Tax=Nonomuraea corallina TaxID=2989783 RepID=A0ABT4SKD5_9ACTN|nr:STAS domain-containing protein [Nonomuraea corallina]MDA0637663.1 STAS domain-containing protein [Nonomuraea corallina]